MKKIYALILLVVVIASCKDDDPKIDVQATLTGATNGWVFESIIVTNPISGQKEDLVNDPDAFEECDLDDAIIFASGGTYTVATNVKCDPSDPDTQDSGTWALNADKTTLTVISTSEGPLMTLTKLSVDGTTIKGETSSFLDLPIVAEITMKKK